MSDLETHNHVLLLTACLMAVFGALVLAGAVVAKARRRSASHMVTAYLAWFVLLPPIVLPLAYSRALFQVVVLLLSLQCIREFSRVTGLWTDRGLVRLCFVATLGIYLPLLAGWHTAHQLAPMLAVGVLVLLPIARARYEHMLQKISLSVLAVLYFGWFLSHLACLRSLDHGVAWAFYLLVLVECNDALGYLWGRWLGRRKLIPRISPNKTVEGAALATATVVAIAYLLRGLLPNVGAVAALLLGLLASVCGTCGDLVVSVIKRDLDVKDTGSVIPGHGGVLDRCDSLILSAPVFFQVVRYVHAA
jgi:phosphatidate cytidylyltransferase